MSFGFRLVAAFGFCVFVVTGAFCWIVIPAATGEYLLWWIPFAVALGFMGTVCGALTIALGSKFWRE